MTDQGTFAYLGIDRDGICQAIATERIATRDQRIQTAEIIGGLIRDGFHLKRVPIDEARRSLYQRIEDR